MRRIQRGTVVAATAIVAATLTAASGAARAADHPYAMKDLVALDKQGAHEELLSHAEDVAPSARDQHWQALLERAAIAVLEARGSAKDDGWLALSLASELSKRYPSLRKSTAFGAKRKDVVLKYAPTCFERSDQGQECLDALLDTMTALPGDRDFAFKAGGVVVGHQNHYVAVPFYYAAVVGGNGAYCADAGLGRAVTAGMGLPPNYENAKKAREVVEKACFEPLKVALQKQVATDGAGSYLAANTCPVLKAKQQLGAAAAACATVK